MSGPVGVDEFARVREEFVGVCPEIVSLGLNEIGWYRL